MAVPGIDESSVLLRAFPSVYPNPGWSGSMANFARVGVSVSSWIWGRATMSN
jgi:hypothetical protein